MLDLFAANPTLDVNVPKVAADAATLGSVLSWVYGLVGLVAVIFIIVGGIRYALSGGDAAGVKQAKDTITYAIVGLVLVILAYTITQFVVKSVDGSSWANLRDSVVNTLIYAVGIIATVMIIVSGFRYTTSGGDAAKVTSAKNGILYSVIGLGVAILAYTIVNFVIGIF